MTTPAPVDSMDSRGGLTRRQFLGWSAAASAGLLWGGSAWAQRQAAGLGIVGLGERGRRALAASAAVQGLGIEGVCDLDSAAFAGLPARLPRFEEAGRLFTAPNVQAVVLAVPAPAMPALAREALAAGRTVLLTRPMPWELASAGADQVEIVPALYYSLSRPTAGFCPEPAAGATAVELVARSRGEAAWLATEALESAAAWLGGQPVSSRVFGGRTLGRGLCFGARGTVLLEHHEVGAQRMDFHFRIDPSRQPAGRMTIASRGGELTLGLWPRSSGAPSAGDLAALLAGIGGFSYGLKLSAWSRAAGLYRELMAEIEG